MCFLYYFANVIAGVVPISFAMAYETPSYRLYLITSYR